MEGNGTDATCRDHARWSTDATVAVACCVVSVEDADVTLLMSLSNAFEDKCLL